MNQEPGGIWVQWYEPWCPGKCEETFEPPNATKREREIGVVQRCGNPCTSIAKEPPPPEQYLHYCRCDEHPVVNG